MVTRLPSSGLPAEQRRGCDTSDLIQVHRIFRWLYAELPGLIRAVADGDVPRASVVADYARIDFFALHLHHETEDLVLWDRLEERSPGCAAHVDQMRAQHAEVARLLAEVEPLLDPWREHADVASRDRLAAGVEQLRDTLLGHLDPEEQHIVPVAASVLTQSEWDEMSKHARDGMQAARKELPRDLMALEFGLMVSTIPPDERPAWMKENVPAPIRLLYTLLLKRKYERAMDELYEGRPVPPIP